VSIRGRSPSATTNTLYKRVVLLPELPLAMFGFLTHFVWEMLQVPLFVGMAEAPHNSVVWMCIRATGGDVLILLISFWLSSLVRGHRRWLLQGERKPAITLVITALVVTIIMEWLATGQLERWEYANTMPIIPLVGIGLAPLLQWLLLSPLIMWLARRHMLGHIAFQSIEEKYDL
jgi:hypothetical protein